jgi:hypothetical protein
VRHILVPARRLRIIVCTSSSPRCHVMGLAGLNQASGSKGPAFAFQWGLLRPHTCNVRSTLLA